MIRVTLRTLAMLSVFLALPSLAQTTCPTTTPTGKWFKVVGTNPTLVVGFPACTQYRYGHAGAWTTTAQNQTDQVYVPTDAAFNWTGVAGANELDIMETGVVQIVTATKADGSIVAIPVPVAPGLTAPTTVVPIQVVTTTSTTPATLPSSTVNAAGDVIVRYPHGYSVPVGSCAMIPASGPSGGGTVLLLACTPLSANGQAFTGNITVAAPPTN